MTVPSLRVRADILLVDDRPERLLALRTILSDLGEEIVESRSGREALRHLLQREFSVILLDVNMPELDGFETASLIRRRKLTEHTPIIFITGYNDDTHVARGYSLGAVDYIVAPVEPEILRTKVSVFVDLFRKSAQIRLQAEIMHHRAEQLQRLTRASLAINSALSLDETLCVVAESARDLLRARAAVVFSLADDAGLTKRAVVADETMTSDLAIAAYEERYGSDLPVGGTPAVIMKADGTGLSAVLTRRNGAGLGWIHAACSSSSEPGPDEEALFTQFARVAAIAIENTLSGELREANRLKDEFLATVSHELRTPLSVVLAWAQILRGAPQEPDRLARGLEIIERNALSQAKLVEDLLDVARISLGKLQLFRRTFDLSSLLETAVEAMRPAAAAKGVALHLETSKELSSGSLVSGDSGRMQQVFTNLLSNALKFTPGGGHVVVSLVKDEAEYRVSVRDDGKGISPAFLRVIFERFRQADPSTSREHGGLGIGLAIVRHLVEGHGGTVNASSEGLGLGSTFTVFLPVALSADQSLPAPASDARSNLAGLRVLLVDDDEDGREAVSEMLRSYSASVTPAGSLQDALERLDPSHDILVTDIGMPGGSGFDLLARVRELPVDRGGSIPAIALTAYARPDDRRQALDAGFQSHLAKPVEPDHLAGIIRQLVPRSRKDSPVAQTSLPRVRRILVVDDDGDSRDGLKMLLETSGHLVEVAAAGREAIEKARRDDLDVALIDARLPDMAGHEVARTLRSERPGKPIILIALSGLPPMDPDSGAKAFDAWLMKPLDIDRLNALLSMPDRGSNFSDRLV